MKLEREIDIAASPEEVWDRLTNPRCLDEWVTIHDKLVEAPEGDLSQGDELVQRVKVAGQRFKVRWTVDESTRPERIVWSGKGPMRSKAHAIYEISPNGEGSHFRYVNEWELPGGIAGRTLGAAIKGAAAKEADRSLEKLKQLLER